MRFDDVVVDVDCVVVEAVIIDEVVVDAGVLESEFVRRWYSRGLCSCCSCWRNRWFNYVVDDVVDVDALAADYSFGDVFVDVVVVEAVVVDMVGNRALVDAVDVRLLELLYQVIKSYQILSKFYINYILKIGIIK